MALGNRLSFSPDDQSIYYRTSVPYTSQPILSHWKPEMKKTLRITAILMCNLLILLLLLELAGLVVHYRREGELFYLRTAEDEPAEFTMAGERLISEYRLQPYWGFSLKINQQKPRKKVSTNNYGFISKVDYPMARSGDRQLIIGIFGGSVATQLTVKGADRLKEVLSADQRLADRELVVLDFASGGYKQPQQLQILTYFLSQGQEFDLVINLDGFNEVALSPFNRRSDNALAMPSNLHLLPLVNLMDHSTLTPERLESLHRITRLKDRLQWVTTRLQETPSAAVHLLLGAWSGRLNADYSAEVNRFQQMKAEGTAASLMGIAGLEEIVVDDETMFQSVTDGWVESSLLMQQLLSVRGVPYYHFLQPNQYFTNRVFSEEEQALAIREDSPLRGNAANGYPYLLERADWLASRGVRFHDATGIFDLEPEPVYDDDCCHYNQLGNELLAEFIGERLLETWPE